MKVYRSRHGQVFGVCKGIEESTGFPARYTRGILILAAILFRGWYVLAAYILAALFMPVKSRTDNRGFRENFEDLRSDAINMAEKEYREFLRYAVRNRKEEPATGTE